MDILKRLYRKLEVKRAYVRLFNTEDGQTVLRDLAREVGITSPDLTVRPDERDVQIGQQRVVYSILRQSQQPEDFILQQIEAINQQQEEE